MSPYATAARGHDAEWLLHQERLLNDRMMASARRFGGKVIAKHVGEVATVPAPDPGETAAATRTARRIAAEKGLDDAALAEVLDALGLTPPPAPAETWTPGIAAPARPGGICRTCGRKLHLRKDRTLIVHNRNSNLPAGDSPCPGSKTLPRSETR